MKTNAKVIVKVTEATPTKAAARDGWGWGSAFTPQPSTAF